MLFLPERLVPDEFFTTLCQTVSFNRTEFKEFFIYMDPLGDWILRVHEIIRGNPLPRSTHLRP